MLDRYLHSAVDPLLARPAKLLAKRGVTPNAVTIAGFMAGLCAFAALALAAYKTALLFLAINRVSDGLDGALARAIDASGKTGSTDFGGYIDIVSDFIFYAGFVFFFAVGAPETALYAAFLIFSFMGTASTFLAHAILAARRGVDPAEAGRNKTIYYLGGLTEGSETIIVFALFCVIPQYFGMIAIVFGALCWLTTVSRITMTAQGFYERAD